MRKGFGRVLHLIEGRSELSQCERPLITDQNRAEDGRDNDRSQGPAKANGPTDLDKQRDFDQRYRKKGDKQPHFGTSFRTTYGGLDGVLHLHKTSDSLFPYFA